MTINGVRYDYGGGVTVIIGGLVFSPQNENYEPPAKDAPWYVRPPSRVLSSRGLYLFRLPTRADRQRRGKRWPRHKRAQHRN